MKSLMCVVIGNGSLFSVNVDENETVAHLKQKIKEKKPSTVHCHADKLTLFAANNGINWRESGEQWLHVEDPSLKLLKQSDETPPDILAIMTESRELHPISTIGDVFKSVPPTDNEIHVLVKLPQGEPLRKRRCTNAQVKKLNWKADQNFVDDFGDRYWYKIQSLEMAGQCSPEFRDKVIYCREDMRGLLDALDKMERGIRINGPPGMGKSITTWLWVCNQVKKGRSVLWIHVLNCVSERIIRLTPSGAYFIVPNDKLSFVEDAEDDIIVLNGLTEDVRELGKRVFSFFKNDHRQAISIASVYVKTNCNDNECLRLSSFDMTPGTLDEYYAAVENEAFFTSVQPYLETDIDKKTAINHKFYFAGLSVRWMFGMNRSEVIQDIAKCFDHCPNSAIVLSDYSRPQSTLSVNYLSCDQGPDRTRFFTSQYIARLAMDKVGVDMICLAYQVAKRLNCDDMAGWVVEMDFVQQLKDATGSCLEVLLHPQGSKETIQVAHCARYDVDILEFIKAAQYEDATLKCLDNVWLLPAHWNQPRLDLVCLRWSRNRLVLRFVQVTSTTMYELKLEHVETLALKLRDNFGLNIDGIEVIVAVPSDVSMIEMSIQGDLSDWFVGDSDERWDAERGKDQVKVVKFKKTQSD
ncbi:hypothetical protein AC1031_020820 [Aphanomyces cochlioides]|nr:hypothetical protein AC1031_020820 [Aphanomyces cochlioides]